MKTELEGNAEEIELRSVFALLWKERWIILVVGSLFATAGLVYALMARELYTASSVLMQTQSTSPAVSMGQLGNLASLVGVDLGAAGDSQVPIAVLKSEKFARMFIESEGLLSAILMEDRKAGVKSWLSSAAPSDLDMRDAVSIFDKKVRTVVEDQKTGLVVLSVVWTDAETAARWANRLVSYLNAYLRSEAIKEAEKNIEYLQEVSKTTNVVPLQQSAGRILEAELQKLMLARGMEEYAFKVIDPAEPPKRRSSPKRFAILLTSGFLGILFASICVLMRGGIAPKSQEMES